MDKLIRSLLASIKQANKKKTSSYDTTAQVRRIEGNTAWVHIPGGVDETPVKLTVNAEPGDTVQLRVGGGTAWITGNATAPPTDDKVAKVANRTANAANVLAGIAKKTADEAGKTATNYLSWSAEYGLIVSEDATENPEDMQGGSTRVTSDGVSIYKGLIRLAMFGATVLIGRVTEYAVEVAASAVSFIKNNTVVAKLYQDTGETVLEDYDSKNKLILGTAGMRLCDDQGQGLTVSGGIATAENLPAMVECGIKAGATTPANSYQSFQITFSKTFTSAPVVTATIQATSSSVDFNKTQISVYSITTSGFYIRVYNGMSSQIAPNISWIAMEQ